ncbi:hypothetical protein H0E87_009700 [Populus deltoides]|uniref:Uncharacterized protein n=1 Tax=Populus deltoides TaxID=3696 RepID=A0A8T2YQ49_POPDE|nr:hypothetical protein H0E87_009700 [Populus deltoides]
MQLSCDLNRLFANFQSWLHVITVIATEPTSMASDIGSETGGKFVRYVENILKETKTTETKQCSSMHTRLWIEPAEEFAQYTHDGDPVDVTFCVGTEGVEVLVRVFITFVSYAQVDEYVFLVLFTEGIQYYVRSSKMGCSSWKNRVLVNRLISQLREGNPSEPPHLATSTHGKARDGTGSRGQQCRVNVSEQP